MITVNSIAKSYLLDRGYPMHWYLSALKQACEGTKELAMHTISIIKTEVITVDKNGFACFPHDYFSYVRLAGGQNGQLQPLSYAATGLSRNVPDDGVYGLPTGWYGGWVSWYGPNFNELGERTESLTGYVYSSQNTFEEIKESRKFRFNGCYAGTQIVLDYIPVLGKCNNSTLVPDEAETTIRDYIHWKLPRYERGRQIGLNADDERIFNRSLRILRAFNNKITPERLAQIREEVSYRGYK